MRVSQTFLVFEDLDVLRSTGEVFCRMSLNLNLPDVFIMITRVLGSGKKTTEGKCHFHHIISAV